MENRWVVFEEYEGCRGPVEVELVQEGGILVHYCTGCDHRILPDGAVDHSQCPRARLQDQNEETAAAAGDEDAAGRPIAGEVEYDRAKAEYEREAR